MLFRAPLAKLAKYMMLSVAIISVSSCSSIHSKQDTTTQAPPLPEATIEETLSFDQETLYALITAELALVRGRYELGLGNYVQQARDTQDVQVAARAAQIARILKRHSESLEMAEMWVKLDPSAREARFILVSEYIHAGRFQEAFAQSEQLLRAGSPGGFEDIAIEALRKDNTNTSELKAQYQRLLNKHPDNPELLVGYSILLQEDNALEAALTHAQRAVKVEPDSSRAIYQEYRALSELKRDDEALAAYAKLVDIQPDNFRARSRYAGLLLKKNLDESLKQYQILHAQDPQNEDVLLNIALIQQDRKYYPDAINNFKTLIGRNKHVSASHFRLGEIHEALKKDDDALPHYLNVKSGPHYVAASSHAANIISRKSGLDDASVFLGSRRETATDDDKEDLYLVEADTLSNHGFTAKANAVYSMGLQAFPNSVKLLYSRAMHFTLLNETLSAEQDFKRVLETLPDNAATLNALGFTLLDQTDRIEEAEIYIRKAYALEPDNVAIIDSLGWLEYKLGNNSAALTLLEQALDAYMDDEISAHLGEVLWKENQKRRARSVWRKGLEHAPNSKPIKQTLERLNIDRL